MNKIISSKEASSLFRDGMNIMAGGFMGGGTPCELVSKLLEADVKDLTLIKNDTAFAKTGVGPMTFTGTVLASKRKGDPEK